MLEHFLFCFKMIFILGISYCMSFFMYEYMLRYDISEMHEIYIQETKVSYFTENKTAVQNMILITDMTLILVVIKTEFIKPV